MVNGIVGYSCAELSAPNWLVNIVEISLLTGLFMSTVPGATSEHRGGKLTHERVELQNTNKG
jgi:hypothetical protein